MSNKVLIFWLIILTVLSLVIGFGVVSLNKTKYSTENSELTDQINTKREALDKIKTDKDGSGYLPTYVVRYFLNESKAESFEKAKLYLSKNLKDQNIGDWLGYKTSLPAINVGDLNYEINGEKATVTANIKLDTSDKSEQLTFSLAKEDFLWKITDFKRN